MSIHLMGLGGIFSFEKSSPVSSNPHWQSQVTSACIIRYYDCVQLENRMKITHVKKHGYPRMRTKTITSQRMVRLLLFPFYYPISTLNILTHPIFIRYFCTSVPLRRPRAWQLRFG